MPLIKPCHIDATEGDVETQVALPIFEDKNYLFIPRINIKSKEYLAPLDIDKGRSRQSGYIPDYCIYVNSLPVCVIEVKSPSNSTEDAYVEACLYAHALNRCFGTKINPCSVAIGTNGITIRAGSWDSAPIVDCRIEDLLPGSKILNDFRQLAMIDNLRKIADFASEKITFTGFKRPFNQDEGPALINSKVGTNTFAADLGPILTRYFTSRSQSDDIEIYDRAYIKSTELSSHDRNLDSFLKDRITLSRRSGRTELRPTNKDENQLESVVRNHEKHRPIGGALQLMTGGVGAGKSLFARRYKEFLQTDDLKLSCHWAFLDFNDIPRNLIGGEEWVCSTFVSSLLREGAPFDPTDPSDQERIFAPNLAQRKAYYDRMNSASSNRGDLEQARDIEQWRLDPLVLAESAARYLQGDRGECLIVVFDNVDRRDSEEQLGSFQLALWFMAKTRAMVLLQMRDVTFELHKNEPPLDTYRSGIIFHISPPRFIDVVKRRLELSLEHLSAEAPDTVSYELPSGTKISYPKTRAGEYLNAIYAEVFQRPRNVGTILEALSGRNVRQALDMFMSIITSGHMPEDLITSVARGHSSYEISEYRLIKILMRGDYRFFNNNSGFVTNIFYCDNNWKRPNNFLISEILYWIIVNRRVAGDNGHLGYFAVGHISNELEKVGFVRNDVHEGCKFALKEGLIEADTLSLIELIESDCVKATASGWAHLRILSERVEYLHAVLPTTPIYSSNLRGLVFDRMKIENRYGDLNYNQACHLVREFLKYLREQKKCLDEHPQYERSGSGGATYILGKMQASLDHTGSSQRAAEKKVDELDE